MTPDDRALAVHDLKNQLGIILGFAEFLLTELPADDPHRDDATEIRDAAQRAAALVARLSEEPGTAG